MRELLDQVRLRSCACTFWSGRRGSTTKLMREKTYASTTLHITVVRKAGVSLIKFAESERLGRNDPKIWLEKGRANESPKAQEEL